MDTSGFTADDGHNFIFSARVGGANQDLFIDNLVIEVGIFDGDEDQDAIPDFYENEVAGNLTDLNGNEAGPGPWMVVLVAHGDVLQILQTSFARVDVRQHRSLEHLQTATLRELVQG